MIQSQSIRFQSINEDEYLINYIFTPRDENVIFTRYQQNEIRSLLPRLTSANALIQHDFMYEFQKIYLKKVYEETHYPHRYVVDMFYLVGYQLQMDEYRELQPVQVAISTLDDLEPDSVVDVLQENLTNNRMTFKQWVEKCKFINDQFYLVVEIGILIDPDFKIGEIQLESNLCNGLCTLL